MVTSKESFLEIATAGYAGLATTSMDCHGRLCRPRNDTNGLPRSLRSLAMTFFLFRLSSEFHSYSQVIVKRMV